MSDVRPPAYKTFLAIVQADFPRQMDVFRWLCKDSFFRVCWILHDRDKFDEYDKKENGKILRSMPDTDEKREFQVGDTKPPHYHMIIVRPKKCTMATMDKEFGHYLNFQGCSDAFAYARYLTHDTFDSQHKAHYLRAEVRGDLELYADLIGRDKDVCNTLKRWNEYLARARDEMNLRDGAVPDDIYIGIQKLAVQLAIQDGDSAIISSMMSHAFFYSKFF